jgi:endoglucanase
VRGIVVPNLHQYHHPGDAITETDNYIYDPRLKPYQNDGKYSGTMDDRWAFTNRSASLDYSTAGALAAATRPLKNFNKPLADRCLADAIRMWDENANQTQNTSQQSGMGFGNAGEMNAAFQLYLTTKDQKYLNRFLDLLWPSLERGMGSRGGSLLNALQAIPYMDIDFKARLKEMVIKYKESVDAYAEDNPNGVPISGRSWGGGIDSPFPLGEKKGSKNNKRNMVVLLLF